MLQELFVHSISFVAFTGELAIPLLPGHQVASAAKQLRKTDQTSRPGKHLMRT